MQRFFKSAHFRKSEKEHLLSVWYSPLLFLLFFRGCRFCLFFSESYSKEILVRMQPRSANSEWGNLKNRRKSEKKVPFRSSLKWFFLWSFFIFCFGSDFLSSQILAACACFLELLRYSRDGLFSGFFPNLSQLAWEKSIKFSFWWFAVGFLLEDYWSGLVYTALIHSLRTRVSAE